MTAPSVEASIREWVIGRRLSGVSFVMDYVVLQFDPPPTINALTPITVRSGERTAVSGEESFRNLLCEQIPKTVVSVALIEEDSLTFAFEDGSRISLSLLAEDRQGREAVNVVGRDHFFLVT